MGEEGVLLEKVSHPPLLGRQVDAGHAVKKGRAVQEDFPPVRGQNSRNAPEGDGFPAAGGPQQGQGPGLCLKLYTQVKIPKPLFHIYQKGHHAPPFRRVSSRFSASRNAAEMARFTSTHWNAPAVSPVRQSW